MLKRNGNCSTGGLTPHHKKGPTLRRKRRHTHPELGRARRCRLVVFEIRIGGKWAPVRPFAGPRACSRLQAAARAAWVVRWGFRSNRGTGDAIFVARRLIEHAWAAHDGSLLLLFFFHAPSSRSLSQTPVPVQALLATCVCSRCACRDPACGRSSSPACLSLGWARAFDSVAPGALVKALRRSGIPTHFCRVVQVAYFHRRFQLRVDGQMSTTRYQKHSISQGCPLSPFL